MIRLQELELVFGHTNERTTHGVMDRTSVFYFCVCRVFETEQNWKTEEMKNVISRGGYGFNFLSEISSIPTRCPRESFTCGRVEVRVQTHPQEGKAQTSWIKITSSSIGKLPAGMYSVDSIIRTVSIKRTVWKNFHMTLLNVPYDLKVALKINKRTASIKRTVWHLCCLYY